MGKFKKIFCWFFVIMLFLQPFTGVYAEESGESLTQAPSVCLMEAETGTVLYAKGEKEKRSPASITKIMTLLLIFDAIEEGNLKLSDTVTTSAYAKSMGGSQVFLEEGETQDVETMIKCIVIASGNDASVAMAEHLCGTEEEFVKKMNERALGLGMKDTHFVDCCGLTDSKLHYTTAMDIAVMSKELITKYPQVLTYSSIWMEDITHTTAKGSSPFTLTNTNKLIRGYDGCVGLKTGSTSLAKYCLSAVAERKDITLIATVMAAPDYKIRFKDAAAMLNYGFGKCDLYKDNAPPKLPKMKVVRGVEKKVALAYDGTFRYLKTDGKGIGEMKRIVKLKSTVKAPIKKGEKAGVLEYQENGKKIGELDILYKTSVKKAGYGDCLKYAFEDLLF